MVGQAEIAVMPYEPSFQHEFKVLQHPAKSSKTSNTYVKYHKLQIYEILWWSVKRK